MTEKHLETVLADLADEIALAEELKAKYPSLAAAMDARREALEFAVRKLAFWRAAERGAAK